MGMVTFPGYFEKRVAAHRNLELKTRQGYASHFRKSLNPEFVDVPLCAITPVADPGVGVEAGAR